MKVIEELEKKIQELKAEKMVAELELEIKKIKNTRIEEETIIKRQIIKYEYTYPNHPYYPNYPISNTTPSFEILC